MMSAGDIRTAATLVGLAACAASAAQACNNPPLPPSRKEALAAAANAFVFRGKVIETYERCVRPRLGKDDLDICYLDAKIEVLENISGYLEGTILVKDIALWIPFACNFIPQSDSEQYSIVPLQVYLNSSRLVR